MLDETTKKIIAATGRKPTRCKCSRCASQCMVSPCLGTPDDIEKIIDAGYSDKISPTVWLTGLKMGFTDRPVPIYAPKDTYSGCIFFKNGLCSLHDSGLKPTEGKLSHHTQEMEEFNAGRSVGWNVIKEWLDPINEETINRIGEKLQVFEPKDPNS